MNSLALVSHRGWWKPLAFRRSKAWCNVVACDITDWARTRRATSRSIWSGFRKYRKAVLTGDVAIGVRDLLRQVVAEHELSHKVTEITVSVFIIRYSSNANSFEERSMRFPPVRPLGKAGRAEDRVLECTSND
jgi:hypothetical protein